MILNTVFPEDDSTLYIFKAGSGLLVPCTTGKQSRGSITVGTDSITYTYSSDSYRMVSLCTNSAIDLTNYSKFVCRAYPTKAPGGTYGTKILVNGEYFVIGDAPGDIEAQTKFTEKSAYYNFEIDISSLSGSYYLGLWGYGTGTITDMYLEK